MKHPILYRVVFYSAFAILCGSTLFLIKAINYAPFKSSDMRSAYYHGCNFGTKNLTQESVERCNRFADVYENTLDDLDRQMEKLIDKSKHNE